VAREPLRSNAIAYQIDPEWRSGHCCGAMDSEPVRSPKITIESSYRSVNQQSVERDVMRAYASDVQTYSSLKIGRAFPVLLSLLFCLWPSASAQLGESPLVSNTHLGTEQIVRNLVAMNFERAKALHAYQGSRTYRVEYRGFPGIRSAEMVVDIKYQSPGSKEFTIQSAIGSKMLIDKVFKKLLQTEKEALAAEAQVRTALNSDNYDFTLVGQESTPSGSRYVLTVEPKTKDKLLFRGRIWVDAKDFAVARLEAEPAKNPSFWTKNSEIEQVYMKVNDFWLPESNRSSSMIRLGGRAELTIQYSNYKITGADPVGNSSALEPKRSTDTAYAQRLVGHR
jgi:hypothetical protein